MSMKKVFQTACSLSVLVLMSQGLAVNAEDFIQGKRNYLQSKEDMQWYTQLSKKSPEIAQSLPIKKFIVKNPKDVSYTWRDGDTTVAHIPPITVQDLEGLAVLPNALEEVYLGVTLTPQVRANIIRLLPQNVMSFSLINPEAQEMTALNTFLESKPPYLEKFYLQQAGESGIPLFNQFAGALPGTVIKNLSLYASLAPLEQEKLQKALQKSDVMELSLREKFAEGFSNISNKDGQKIEINPPKTLPWLNK